VSLEGFVVEHLCFDQESNDISRCYALEQQMVGTGFLVEGIDMARIAFLTTENIKKVHQATTKNPVKLEKKK